MRPESSADFCAPVSCHCDREYRRTSPSHVDRCRNTVYVAACRTSSRCPPWDGLCGTAILPLPLAAQEAWMSITPRHRIAATVGYCKTGKATFWPLAVRGSVDLTDVRMSSLSGCRPVTTPQ